MSTEEHTVGIPTGERLLDEVSPRAASQPETLRKAYLEAWQHTLNQRLTRLNLNVVDAGSIGDHLFTLDGATINCHQELTHLSQDPQEQEDWQHLRGLIITRQYQVEATHRAGLQVDPQWNPDIPNPQPVRHALIREFNRNRRELGFPDKPLPVPDRERPDDRTEDQRLNLLAWHIIHQWLPRTLDFQGMTNTAQEARDTNDLEKAIKIATRCWSTPSDTVSPTLSPAAEAGLMAFNVALTARTAPQSEPDRTARRRDRTAESAVTAALALREAAARAGQVPPDIRREMVNLMNSMQNPGTTNR